MNNYNYDDTADTVNNMKVILVTSCKGGVGKSTISANLAVSLAMAGKKTLVIDCDFGMRCLDLIMGVDSNVVYDMYDVIFRGISLRKAAVSVSCSDVSAVDNLYMLAAPYKCPQRYNASDLNLSEEFSTVEKKHFVQLMESAETELGAEYVIIDTPGDIGSPLVLAASVADSALVVATNQPASLRAAERTAAVLDVLDVCNKKLIINGYDIHKIKHLQSAGVIETIDRTYLQLIGIIPYDDCFAEAQNFGGLICDPCFKNGRRYRDSAQAVFNIRDRLLDMNVPLFSNFKNAGKYRKTLGV